MKSWTIGKKLMTGFGVMLAMTLTLSYFSLTAIGMLGGALAANTAKTMELVGTIRLDLQEMIALAKMAQLTYVVNHIKRLESTDQGAAIKSGMECSACHTKDGFENSGREFEAIAMRVKGQIAELRPAVLDANGLKS